MRKGILGRKAGMTTVFTETGKAIPVTVVEVKPNAVLQVKTVDTDGYNSIQLGVEDKRENLAIKPELGIAKKANTSAKYFIKEIREMEGFALGDVVNASLFNEGDYVDVTGTSKGKGFQGSIKRHNQSRGPMSHGSKYHRGTGSLGDIRGTVKRTKKMPGHMGHEQVTMQNLEIISVNTELNYVLVKGSIPGPNKSFVVIKNAIKEPIRKHAIEKLVNVKELEIKNELIEEAKKVNAAVESSMSIEEMKQIIAEATVAHDAQMKEHKVLLEKAKELGINKAEKMSNDELKQEISKVEELIKSREAKEVEEGNNE